MGTGNYLVGAEARRNSFETKHAPKKLTAMLDLNTASVNMQKLAHPLNGPGILACDS
jgi:hypothetical protein